MICRIIILVCRCSLDCSDLMRCVSDNYLTDLELCDSTVLALLQKGKKLKDKEAPKKNHSFRSLFSDTGFWIISGIFDKIFNFVWFSCRDFEVSLPVSCTNFISFGFHSLPSFSCEFCSGDLFCDLFWQKCAQNQKVLLYVLLWTEAAAAVFTSSVLDVSEFHSLGPPPSCSHRLDKTKLGISCLRNITVSVRQQLWNTLTPYLHSPVANIHI